MMTNKEKHIGVLLLLLLFGLIVSSMTLFLCNGIVLYQVVGSGALTYRGFPLAFSHYGDGMAWAKYHGTLFFLNTLTWCCLFIGIYELFRRNRKKSQYKKLLQSKLKLWGSILIIISLLTPLLPLHPIRFRYNDLERIRFNSLMWYLYAFLEFLLWTGVALIISGYALPRIKSIFGAKKITNKD